MPNMSDSGNAWRKFHAVPRLYPLRSLVLYFVCLIRVETEGLLDYQGRWGSFPLYDETFAQSYSVSINKRAVSYKCGFGECDLVPAFGTGEHPYLQLYLVPVFGSREDANVPSFRFLVPGDIRRNHPF